MGVGAVDGTWLGAMVLAVGLAVGDAEGIIVGAAVGRLVGHFTRRLELPKAHCMYVFMDWWFLDTLEIFEMLLEELN